MFLEQKYNKALIILGVDRAAISYVTFFRRTSNDKAFEIYLSGNDVTRENYDASRCLLAKDKTSGTYPIYVKQTIDIYWRYLLPTSF